MKRILLSPMPWAVLALIAFCIVSYFQDRKENHTDHFRVWSLEPSPGQEADYALLRAFVSPQGMYGIALEGGRQPAPIRCASPRHLPDMLPRMMKTAQPRHPLAPSCSSRSNSI
jgi:hypothetical protein